MSLSTHKTAPETGSEENGKVIFVAQEMQKDDVRHQGEEELDGGSVEEITALERKLVRKIDLRLYYCRDPLQVRLSLTLFQII